MLYLFNSSISAVIMSLLLGRKNVRNMTRKKYVHLALLITKYILDLQGEKKRKTFLIYRSKGSFLVQPRIFKLGFSKQ